MKIWIRFVLGIAIGVTWGLLTDDVEAGSALWERLSAFALDLGRYMLVPVAFFGTAISVHDLKENHRALATYAKAALCLVVAAAIAVALGLLSVIFVGPAPLPIILEEPPIPSAPSVLEILAMAIPENALSVFSFQTSQLIGAVVFAAFLGATIATDNRYASLLEDIIDGLSRVIYTMNAILVQILGIALIAVATSTVLNIRMLGDQSFFFPIILLTAVAAAVLTLGIYPLLVYLFGGRWNPAPWLLGMIPPALAALISGHLYFAGGTLTYLARENLGVKRQVGGAIVPFALLFARAGSAMVASISFIVVLNSYSGLEVGLGEVLWVAGVSFVLSFGLVAVPGSGVLVLLGMLSAGYAQGLEEAYLILNPAAPILLAIAAYVDVMTAGATVRIVAARERQRTLSDVSDFV